ncbi:MAG: hypothetical protein J5802_12240 [Butyrivibrio sp.]|nr:hypothetical protein [Butyrivibrio sp.]
MKRTKPVVILGLTALFVTMLFITCLRLYGGNITEHKETDTQEEYNDAEETLLGYLGVDQDKENTSVESGGNDIADLNANSRFTQRVTVRGDGEMLPVSGTVTKDADAFYPGTYEISFSTNAILTEQATIEVEMDVLKGDEVYILTGDKDSGYEEFAVVTADKYNTVRFTTDKLQTYTLSKTNIAAAQEAMAGIIGNY